MRGKYKSNTSDLEGVAAGENRRIKKGAPWAPRIKLF